MAAIRAGLLLVLFCLMPGAAIVAADDPNAAGRALIERFLTDVKTLAGDFEQSVLDAEGEVLDVSSGTIEIERPGRFRWATVEPYEQWLVADGLNIWSYDVDLAQVTVKPQADALTNTPALLLGGDSSALEAFDIERTLSDGGMTWVRLVPVDTSSGFRQVELGFVGEELSRMVFLDSLDQQTVVSLSAVSLNDGIDAARFEFTAPEGVDVVGTPAVAETP